MALYLSRFSYTTDAKKALLNQQHLVPGSIEGDGSVMPRLSANADVHVVARFFRTDLGR